MSGEPIRAMIRELPWWAQMLIVSIFSIVLGGGTVGATLISRPSTQDIPEQWKRRVEAVETLATNTAQVVMNRTDEVSKIAALKATVDAIGETQRMMQQDMREVRNLLLQQTRP